MNMKSLQAGFLLKVDGFPNHSHQEYYEFHLFHQSSGTITNGTETFAIKKNALIFTPPGCSHHVERRSEQQVSFHYIKFKAEREQEPLLAELSMLLHAIKVFNSAKRQWNYLRE